MRRKTFFLFVGPSLAMMLVFIAVPLVSVLIQSFQLTVTAHEERTEEQCVPLVGCRDVTVTVPVLDENGEPVTSTEWVGLRNFRGVVQPEALAEAFSETGRGLRDVLDIDFFKALRFTVTFTFITLPLVLVVGLGVALAVNTALARLKGPIIFVSLLPFIITPVIGALSIRWLFIGDGILTAGLEWLTGRDIAMFAQGWTIELMMLGYRVWHVAPFAFVIFYAALQTVNQDAIEAAMVDGASRFERLRYIIVPHLMPLIVFVTLIHLMDSYRVFEEIIGFRAEAHRISLQWMTWDLLTPDDSGNRSIERAAANSMLTMIGIIILLIPVLRRTWREQRGG